MSLLGARPQNVGAGGTSCPGIPSLRAGGAGWRGGGMEGWRFIPGPSDPADPLRAALGAPLLALPRPSLSGNSSKAEIMDNKIVQIQTSS